VGKKTVKFPGAVEPLHLDAVVHRFTVTSDPKCALSQNNGEHAEIEVTTEPPVEAELFVAVKLSLFKGREIKKPQVDRFF